MSKTEHYHLFLFLRLFRQFLLLVLGQFLFQLLDADVHAANFLGNRVGNVDLVQFGGCLG